MRLLASLAALVLLASCGQVPQPEGPAPDCGASTAEVFAYFNSTYMTVEEATELTRLHAENCRTEQSNQSTF